MFKVKKHYKIGLSCTPSNFNGNPEEIKAEEIFITFGGGMGGGNKSLYATKVSELKNGMLSLTLIGGKKIEVNPRFIVTKEKVKIIKLKTDNTAYTRTMARHRGKEIGLDKTLEAEYFRLNQNDTYEIVHDYVPRHDGDLKHILVGKE